MPPMPKGNPWPNITVLLQAEWTIRTEGAFDDSRLDEVDPYWADLIRLLQVFRAKKNKEANRIKALRRTMSSGTYYAFIDKVLGDL